MNYVNKNVDRKKLVYDNASDLYNTLLVDCELQCTHFKLKKRQNNLS